MVSPPIFAPEKRDGEEVLALILFYSSFTINSTIMTVYTKFFPQLKFASRIRQIIFVCLKTGVLSDFLIHNIHIYIDH